MPNRTTVASILWGLLLLGGCWHDAHAQTARQIADNTFPSVVLLVAEDANGKPIGFASGFFVRDDIVATNYHVIENSARGWVRLVGQDRRYEIAGAVALDKSRDLALLRVVGIKARALPFGNAAQMGVGDDVYVVGNPQGFTGTFSKGIVSSIRHSEAATLFQITAPISQGSSGGPILDTKGQVVGIVFAFAEEGQNLNFAIPVSYLLPLLAQARSSPIPLDRLPGRDRQRVLAPSPSPVAPTRPVPPPEDMRAAPGQPGWSVDGRTGCWIWNAKPQWGDTFAWSGECGPDGRAVGRGTLDFRAADGKMSRFEGAMRDGKPHGRGITTLRNGDRHEGEWRDGKLEGRGIYTWANGHRYEGEFRDGKPNGRGVSNVGHGDGYEGEWRDGRPDGFGEARIEGVRYLGNWAGGCFREGTRRAAVGRPLAECP